MNKIINIKAEGNLSIKSVKKKGNNLKILTSVSNTHFTMYLKTLDKDLSEGTVVCCAEDDTDKIYILKDCLIISIVGEVDYYAKTWKEFCEEVLTKTLLGE